MKDCKMDECFDIMRARRWGGWDILLLPFFGWMQSVCYLRLGLRMR